MKRKIYKQAIKNNFQKSPKVSEMWFDRRRLKTTWTAKFGNLNVFKEAKKQRQQLTTNIRKRLIFGHITREQLEYVVTCGKTDRDTWKDWWRQVERLMETRGKTDGDKLLKSLSWRGRCPHTKWYNLLITRYAVNKVNVDDNDDNIYQQLIILASSKYFKKIFGEVMGMGKTYL